jgi:hypothetical protein
LAFAEAMAGPEEREQAIEVDERVPEALRVRMAEEGVLRYWSFSGAWRARRVLESIGASGVESIVTEGEARG